MTLEEAKRKYIGRRVIGHGHPDLVGYDGLVKDVIKGNVYSGDYYVLVLETDCRHKEWSNTYAKIVDIKPLPLPG